MGDVAISRSRVPTSPLVPLAIAPAAGVVADRLGVPAFGTFAWSTAALVGAGFAALAWRAPRSGGFGLLLAFAALGGAWHHYWWSDLGPDDLARVAWGSSGRRPGWVRGVIVESATFRGGPGGPPGQGRTRTTLALTGINEGRGWRSASGRAQVWIVGDRSDLAEGRAVEAAGLLSGVDGPDNPGEVDYRPILRARGVRLVLSVDDPSSVWDDPGGEDWPWTRWLGRARVRSRERLAKGLDPSVLPLASALLLGRRDEVEPDVNDAFARTGTTHLLAISGLHLQVVAVSLGWFARWLRAGRRTSYAIVIGATVGYSVLVGLAPSVVRSSAMTVGACLAGMRNRDAGPANLLAGALLATLLVNPSDLFDVGCQLSFVAVAAILWWVPAVLAWDAPTLTRLDVLERRLEPWWKMMARFGLAGVRSSLIASTVVSVAAWPLVALRFQVVSPVGIVINLFLIPLTSLALLASGLTLALAMIWPPLGLPTGWLCGACLGGTEWAVRWASGVPWGHWFGPGPPWAGVLLFYALGALATAGDVGRWRPRRTLWAASIACGAVVAAWPMVPTRPVEPEAEVLSVGHGLAVLVRSTEGRALLYDCGTLGDPRVGRKVIAPALWSDGVRRVDALVLSHADADHFDGLPDLLDRVGIGEVRIPPGFEGPANPSAARLLAEVRKRGIPVRPIAEGDAIDLGAGLTLTARHPPRDPLPSSTDNARSVVLEVAHGGRRLLLTGDLEADGLLRLVAQAPGPFDAMLAPHHGGRTSNPAWLYDWAKPERVVVSQRAPTAGSRDPLAPIAEGRFPILRTNESGAIRLRWTPGGLAATGFLDRAGSPPTPTTSARLKCSALAVGLAIGAGFCLFLTAVEWGAWSLVMPGRKPARRPDDSLPPGRPISARGVDGVLLAGALFPNEASDGRTILLLHGMAEDRSALLGRVAPLLRMGWDVAMLDARGAGESGGDRSSFGVRESEDLRAWLDALTTMAGPPRTYLAWGRSMGAFAAIKAAASDPRIAGLILEAPYGDLRRAVAAVLRRLRIPLPGLMARALLLRARNLAGVRLDRPRPVDLAPLVRVPTLILHGVDDPIAPIGDARALARAFPEPADVYEVTGAGHANVVGVGGEALMARVGAFLDEVTTRAGSIDESADPTRPDSRPGADPASPVG